MVYVYVYDIHRAQTFHLSYHPKGVISDARVDILKKNNNTIIIPLISKISDFDIFCYQHSGFYTHHKLVKFGFPGCREVHSCAGRSLYAITTGVKKVSMILSHFYWTLFSSECCFKFRRCLRLFSCLFFVFFSIPIFCYFLEFTDIHKYFFLVKYRNIFQFTNFLHVFPNNYNNNNSMFTISTSTPSTHFLPSQNRREAWI